MKPSSTSKKPRQSKKWVAMMVGVISAMIVFLTSLIAMALNANVAGNVLSLAHTVVAFLGMIVSLLITGQSAVDWKHTSGPSSAIRDGHKAASGKTKPVESPESGAKDKNGLRKQYPAGYKDEESGNPIDPDSGLWS